MKKLIFFLLFFFQLSHSQSNTNIAYLDVQFIIDNSEIGLFYKKKLKTLKESNNKNLKKKQKSIKYKEADAHVYDMIYTPAYIYNIYAIYTYRHRDHNYIYLHTYIYRFTDPSP